MLNYKLIQVFTSESASWRGVPLHIAIPDAIRGMKIAARCLVFKAQGGSYENGALCSSRIEALSCNMPLKIEIVLPAAEADAVLRKLGEMTLDGIVSAHELPVSFHRVGGRLIPEHLLVCDVMTVSPKTASANTPLPEIAKAFLQGGFNGLPIVDAAGRPIGIATQGDLLERAGLPLRLGLLASLAEGQLEPGLKALEGKTAGEIMSSPAVAIKADAQLAEAVELMLKNGLKRLPVLDHDGLLVGMLSRIDIFRTICASSESFAKEELALPHAIKKVKDALPQDCQSLNPDASLEEVLGAIDRCETLRAAVVDGSGKLLGVIDGGELFRLFGHKANLWDRLLGKLSFTELGRRHKELVELSQKRCASELMNAAAPSLSEDAGIDDAIKLMTERKLKSLPAVDAQGVFKGMVSRDALLRLCLH